MVDDSMYTHGRRFRHSLPTGRATKDGPWIKTSPITSRTALLRTVPLMWSDDCANGSFEQNLHNTLKARTSRQRHRLPPLSRKPGDSAIRWGPVVKCLGPEFGCGVAGHGRLVRSRALKEGCARLGSAIRSSDAKRPSRGSSSTSSWHPRSPDIFTIYAVAISCAVWHTCRESSIWSVWLYTI